jgi:hypothetical protein
MKNIKSKIVGLIGGLGALCVLCCSLPIFAILGLGSLEVLFCENKIAQGVGVLLVLGAIGYFVRKQYKKRSKQNNVCAVNCGCKTN